MFDKMRGQPHFSCLILKTELAPVAYLDSLTVVGHKCGERSEPENFC